jgi:hypothetical protein
MGEPAPDNSRTKAIERHCLAAVPLAYSNGAIAPPLPIDHSAHGPRWVRDLQRPLSLKQVFGIVDQMPSGGLVGTWIVDNVEYVAGAGARFDETNAVLGIGAYVAVEYSVQGGVKQVHEIEAHVPPGAGPQTQLGKIDDKGGPKRKLPFSAGYDLGHRRCTLHHDSGHQFQRLLWQPECGCYSRRQQLQGGGWHTGRYPDPQ